MLYNNKKYLSLLKKSLMISGLITLMLMIATIFLQQFEILLVLSSLLIVMIVLIRILNLSFVRIQLENNKIDDSILLPVRGG